MTKDPFVVRKCVLLVLGPDPSPRHNQSLLINTRRVLKDPDGSSLTGLGDPEPTLYHIDNSYHYLIDPSGEGFTSFDYVSRRNEGQELSIFSLLVNANSKLQDAKQRADYPPDVDIYIDLVKLAIASIFFVPDGLQEKASFPVPTSPSHLPKQNLTTPGPSAQSYGGRDDSEGQDPSDIGPKDDDGELDTINGLTFSQMETILQRVSDGTISDLERAEAAMLMLGMGGELSS